MWLRNRDGSTWPENYLLFSKTEVCCKIRGSPMVKNVSPECIDRSFFSQSVIAPKLGCIPQALLIWVQNLRNAAGCAKVSPVGSGLGSILSFHLSQ